MNGQQVLGHQRQQEMFENAVRKGRLGHAYLFAGPDGVGKKLFAQQLAQSLLCSNRLPAELIACGECPGCRQVLSGTHPDLIQVGLPEGKSELPIDLFLGSADKRGREGLCHDLSLSPMHGGHRIAIIDDADTMNIASGNSLLKTLEEPGPGAILILLAIDPDQVIQTIRSRCQSVYFGTLEPSKLTAILQQQAPEAGEAAISQAVSRSQGSARKALDWLQRSEEQSNIDTDAIVKILARGAFRAENLAAAGEVITSQCKSDPLSQREAAKEIIESCLAWFHQSLTKSSNIGDANLVQCDAWSDAMERCFEAIIQIDRRATVATCLDAFYHDLEIHLRPTWNSASARS